VASTLREQAVFVSYTPRAFWSREHHEPPVQSRVEGYASPSANSPVVRRLAASRGDATPWLTRGGVSFR